MNRSRRKNGLSFDNPFEDGSVHEPFMLKGTACSGISSEDEITLAANLNKQTGYSQKDMLRWGASFGAFSAASINSVYVFLSLTTGHIWATDPTNVSIQNQLDRYNPLAKGASAFSTSNNGFAVFSRTVLWYYGLFIVGAAAVTAVINWGYRNYLIRTAKKGDIEATHPENNKNTKSDINQLFHEVVTNDKLGYSPKQMIASGILQLAVFGFFNTIYCFTYLDVSEGAAGKMPTNYGPLYSALDSKKAIGPISYTLNFGLDQWFAFLIVGSAFLAYKFTKLARDSFDKKSGNYSYPAIACKVGLTGFLSILSSLAFVALSAYDKSLKHDWHGFVFYTSIPAAIVVYGLVLNYTGTKGAIDEITEAYNSLTKISEWRHPREVLRSVYQEVVEWGKELYYFLSCCDNAYLRSFAEKHHFPAPARQAPTETTSLLTDDIDIQQASPSSNKKNIVGKEPRNLTDAERAKIKNAELEELKKELGKQVRNPKNAALNLNTNKGYIELHNKILDDLKAERESETTAKDVWKYGRVRKSIRSVFGTIGSATLSVVLFGYFFAVKNSAVAAHTPLGENDADTAMLSLALFWPFIRLVQKSGRTNMAKIYDGIENIVCANKREYFKNFNKEEAVKLTVFTTKLFVFLIAPASAGTVISLLSNVNILKKNPNLLTFAIHTAFWGTAIFNSLGVSKFLGWFEEKFIDWKFYSHQKEAIQIHNRFWKGIEAGANDLDLRSEELSNEGVNAFQEGQKTGTRPAAAFTNF